MPVGAALSAPLASCGLMRTVILAFLLVGLLAAPVALAGGPGSHGDEGKAKAAAQRASAANATADDERRADARHASAERENRTLARERFAENRSVLAESFVSRLHAARASWLENATAVREACHAAEGDNASHCIRNGYRAWRAEHRAEMKELRAELRALLESWSSGRRASH